MPNPPLTDQAFAYIESLLQDRLTGVVNQQRELEMIEHILSTLNSAGVSLPSFRHLVARLNERNTFLLNLPQNIPIL